MMKHICLLLTVFLLCPAPVAPKGSEFDDSLVLVTEHTYRMRKGDSKEKARALAIFSASKKAVALAAKYLTHKNLLEPYGKKQREIFLLATKEIETSILEESASVDEQSYFVKLSSKIKSTDFIQAEIKSLELERKESKFSYLKKMEPLLPKALDPAVEVSRAYRHYRRGQVRIALIYLDALIEKYPHWAEAHIAKAIGFYMLHDTENMMESLRTACFYGDSEACEDLKSLVRLHGRDLTLF